MATAAVYSDIVLPTANWYEKNDRKASDMHSFIHPLQAAVDPTYGSTSDWEISKAIAIKVQEVAPEILGRETDIVALPILHDTPGELAQDQDQVKDWKKGECDQIPGKTAPSFIAVDRDYTAIGDRFGAHGPLRTSSATVARASLGMRKTRCSTCAISTAYGKTVRPRAVRRSSPTSTRPRSC